MAADLRRERAEREIKAVEDALRGGAPALPMVGSHRAGALRVAADLLGEDRASFRNRVGTPSAPGLWSRMYELRPDWDLGLHLAAEQGQLGTDPVLPGFAIRSVSTQEDADGKIKGRSIRQAKAAGDVFEVPAGQAIKHMTVQTDASGRTVQQWVRTSAEDPTGDLVEAIKAAFDGYQGRAELVPEPAETDADLLSTYVITDVHHGLLAYGREAGEDYDIKIGSERLRSCMRDLVRQSPPSEEALILNLGDYFHNNDQRNVTPGSGHQLDVDSRFFKVAVTGVALHQDIIELALQKHKRVRVRIIRGNHDPESSITLQIALAAFYHSNPRVTVDLDPCDLFFHRFGATLIGGCHGDKMKPERMAMSMAMMRPEDWGASKFRWFVFGHIHHESAKEVGNVRCESFQTIAAKDAYATSHGYLAGQSLTSVTLHRERGEIGRHRVNVLPVMFPSAA